MTNVKQWRKMFQEANVRSEDEASMCAYKATMALLASCKEGKDNYAAVVASMVHNFGFVAREENIKAIQRPDIREACEAAVNSFKSSGLPVNLWAIGLAKGTSWEAMVQSIAMASVFLMYVHCKLHPEDESTPTRDQPQKDYPDSFAA